MTRRVLYLLLAAVIGIVALYLSRFWIFEFWGREGLFEIEALRPAGGIVGQWLRGTMLAPFELLIWMVGLFLSLSVVQRLLDRWR